jgi:hypothetical protein
VRRILKAEPVIFDEPDWDDHLYFVLDQVIALFENEEHVARNQIGKPFEFEIGYAIFDETQGPQANLPNALAARHNGKIIIVLNLSIFSHCWSLAADLMALDEFLPEIGNPQGSRYAYGKEHPAFGFMPFYSNEFTVLALEIAVRSPLCLTRARFAIVLRDFMIEATVMHEIGHAILGHLEPDRKRVE